MPTRPNLSDIARQLGVSVATVSNALSGKGRVSRELGEAIRNKAEELGYIPSVAGRALSTGRSNVLGLVLADINQPLFPQFALNIEEAAGELGLGVLIGNSRGDPEEQERAIRRLIERGADGIIVVPRYGTRVTGHRWPIAVIDSPSSPDNTISADHFGGGVAIGRHLRELGHDRVVVVGLYSGSHVQTDRLAGIKAAFDGQELPTIWIQDLERERGPNCPLGLVDFVKEGATAFACVSDLHALRAVTELQHAGLAVPGDVSVTGFDDLGWASVVAPAITTMRMDMKRIARMAIKHILSQLDDSKFEAPDLAELADGVPMELIIRQSSGPAPRTRSSTDQAAVPVRSE